MLVRVQNSQGTPIYEFNDETQSSTFLNGTILKQQCEEGIEYDSKLDKRRIKFTTKDSDFHELFMKYIREKQPKFKISVVGE